MRDGTMGRSKPIPRLALPSNPARPDAPPGECCPSSPIGVLVGANHVTAWSFDKTGGVGRSNRFLGALTNEMRDSGQGFQPVPAGSMLEQATLKTDSLDVGLSLSPKRGIRVVGDLWIDAQERPVLNVGDLQRHVDQHGDLVLVA